MSKRERALVVAIIILLGIVVWQYRSDSVDTNPLPSAIESTEKKEPVEKSTILRSGTGDKQATLMVDVKGAVRSPGVFEMESGQRVNDVVLLAGGFSEDADQNSINLAQVLEDEMVIYVAKLGEEAPTIGSKGEDDGKVDLNEADTTELQTLPGIGPSKAAAIITYREENGPFSAVEDLTNVPGIGEKTLEQLKEFISTEN